MRILVGITGATGVIYGIRLLEQLRSIPDIEVHLVISEWAEKNILLETNYTVDSVKRSADYVYSFKEQRAAVASGSFHIDAMIIVPCTMKTLSAISHGYADNLIGRAADVMLKERRKLIIVPRETPLNAIHLENMLKLCHLGVIILPPMPAFYNKPKSIDDQINHLVGKIMDQLSIKNSIYRRWGE